MRGRIGVWLGLLALLGVNWAGAFLGLGGMRPVWTLLVAVIQAGLIAVFYMAMREAGLLLRMVAGAGLVWLAVMLGLVAGDYGTRGEDGVLGREGMVRDWGR